MPGIRPSADDTSFNTPAMAETSLGDYAKNTVYDALYHSPVSSIYRTTSNLLSEHDTDSQMLTAEEANKQYGMGGQLNFTEPVRDSYASLLQDRKLAEIRRDYELQSGGDSVFRKAAGIGVSMAGSLLDPVNLASMFVGVGEENEARIGLTGLRGAMNRGLINPEIIRRLTGDSMTRFRMAKGFINGTLGTAVVQPFDIIPDVQEQEQDVMKNALNQVAIGGLAGAGLFTIGGAIGDLFRNFSKAGKVIDNQTHEAAVRTAMSDLLQDKPVESPAQVMSVDHDIVENELQQVNTENLVTIAQEHLSRLEQLKEQGTINPAQDFRRTVIGKMLQNPTEATSQNLAKMFELKLNDNIAQMPQMYKFAEGFKEQPKQLAPIEFSKRNADSKFDELEKFNQEFKDHHGLENVGEGDEDEYEEIETATDHLSREDFHQIAKYLLSKGYNILDKDTKFGQGAQSIVFLTDDKAIKLSSTEGSRVPGLTLDKELTAKVAGWNIQVTDRATPLDGLSQHSGIGIGNTEIETALNMLGKAYGINFLDIHAGNLGYDRQGNLRLIDEGAVEGFNPKANPTSGSGRFMWNSLSKKDKEGISREQTLAIYNQLLKQVQDHKNNIQQTTLDRIKSIGAKAQSEKLEAAQKSLDLEKGTGKNPQLEKVKESRTPEQPITAETVSKDNKVLQQEVSDWKKNVETAWEQTSDEELDKQHEEWMKSIENENQLKSMKKGLQAASRCIGGKAI